MREIAPGVFVRRNGKRTMTKSGRRQQIKARRWKREAMFVHSIAELPIFPRDDESTRRFRDRVLGTPTLRSQYGKR